MNPPSVHNTFEYELEAAGVASVVHTYSNRSNFTEPEYEVDDYEVPPVFGRLWREVVSVLTLACAPSLNALSVGSVNIALPTIGRSLNIDTVNWTWIVAAYSIANGCFLLTSGRLADLYGRRRVLFIGSFLYLIFTILCGLSKNGIMLFVFRALQGMSSAIVVPGAVGIVGATYHAYNKRKAIVFAVIGGMATTGFLAGILLGGVCAQLFTWRWLFFISAIIDAVMILSTIFIVPKMAGEFGEDANSEKHQKYKEIDWFGLLLSISGLTLLSFSLTYSSMAPDGWATWYIILLLVVSVVLLGLFYFVEHKRGPRAMMPLKIWKYPRFALVMCILFFGWFDFEVMTLYMTLFLQNVRGVSPLLCVLYFIPDVIAGIIAALAMSYLIPRCRNQFLFLGGILCLLGAPFLMGFSPADQSYWPQTFPAISLSAIGGMSIFNVTNVFVSTAVARKDQGVGQGIFNTVVQIGTAISLAVAATVADAAGARPGASREGFLDGYRATFWLCIGVLGIPLILIWFLKGKNPMPVEQEASEIDEKN